MADAALLRTIEGQPDAPGVYLWKDAGGQVLYIGKADSLRTRLRWYFGDEAAAHPRLVALRDDKRYPWLAVTVQEPFPRILVTRQAADDGARYFGPYTDVGALRHTLRVIRRIFSVRSCTYDLPAAAPERPCLDFHIHKCAAPCVGYETQDAYRGMIGDVLLFLEGRTLEVRQRLRERMREAAAALDYETAAELRDTLARIEQIEERPTVERVGGGDCDAVGLARDEDDACAVVMRIRDGKVVGREHDFLVGVEDVPEGEVLTQFLVRFYLPRPWRSRVVLLPFPPADDAALSETLAPAKWSAPSRGHFRRLTDLADQNARHLLETLRLESFEGAERAEDPVYALGRDLGMTAVPRSIVCADISTAQGRDTVGSLVWFENGRPRRSEYRTYRMKTVEGQDDFASLREMIGRFFRRRLEEQKPLPDLFVVDGGRGQLGAALDAAAQHAVTGPAFASLAKRDEEIFLPGRSEPLRLSRRSPSLKLLQRARDEAHRTAVTFGRKRRAARTITSQLLAIPGVGPSRRRVLLERFGSLAGVRSASIAELMGVPGISRTIAERIKDILAQQES